MRVSTNAGHCARRASALEGGQIEDTMAQRVVRVSRDSGDSTYMLPSADGDDCTMVAVETMYLPMDD